MVNPIPQKTEHDQITIPSGASMTSEFTLHGKTLVGIVTPPTWSATELTFQVSIDGTTFVDLYSDTAEVVAAAAPSRYIALNPAAWCGVVAVKIRAGTTAAPITQAQQQTLTVSVREIT